jgi:RND family efflux transporter MFP subunit
VAQRLDNLARLLRPRRSFVPIVWGVGVSLILVALFAVPWSRHDAGADAKAVTQASQAPLVLVVVAERGKPTTDLVLPASILAYQETAIYARTNGYLKRWLVDIGDNVKGGQLLAEIEAPEVDRELQETQASLAQMQANLALARTTAERYKALIREEAVSPQEVDERVAAFEARKADFAAAEAKVKRLQEQKAFQRVLAPFSGIIVARNAEVGAIITAGGSTSSPWIYKLVQADPLRVRVAVPQNYARLIKVGTAADLLVPENGDQTFSAKVSRMASAFDPATRTMQVELLVPNREGKLNPGMYGQIRFRLINDNPPLVVPVTALLVSGDGVRVATVDANNTVRFKQVKLGRNLGKQVEILQGLAERERVINNPQDTLAEGQNVRIGGPEQPEPAGIKPGGRAAGSS